MTRRHFLKLAGASALLTFAGWKALAFGPQVGQFICSGGRTLYVVKNGNQTIEARRIVHCVNDAITGYISGKCSYGMAVTTEAVEPGMVTMVVVQGPALVRCW